MSLAASPLRALANVTIEPKWQFSYAIHIFVVDVSATGNLTVMGGSSSEAPGGGAGIHMGTVANMTYTAQRSHLPSSSSSRGRGIRYHMA
jgi:hypothetical protein